MSHSPRQRIVALVVGVLAAVSATACSASVSSTTPVTYLVDGDATNVRVGWTVGGKEELAFDVYESLPVGTQGGSNPGLEVNLSNGQIPYVQAQLRNGGSATCSIIISGEVVTTSSMSGKGQMLTCSTNAPLE